MYNFYSLDSIVFLLHSMQSICINLGKVYSLTTVEGRYNHKNYLTENLSALPFWLFSCGLLGLKHKFCLPLSRAFLLIPVPTRFIPLHFSLCKPTKCYYFNYQLYADDSQIFTSLHLSSNPQCPSAQRITSFYFLPWTESHLKSNPCSSKLCSWVQILP